MLFAFPVLFLIFLLFNFKVIVGAVVVKDVVIAFSEGAAVLIRFRLRKLGTLQELSERLGTDRDGVMAWAKEQARIETEKYKSEKESQTVMIPFHQNRMLDYGVQKRFDGGYLFLQCSCNAHKKTPLKAYCIIHYHELPVY